MRESGPDLVVVASRFTARAEELPENKAAAQTAPRIPEVNMSSKGTCMLYIIYKNMMRVCYI